MKFLKQEDLITSLKRKKFIGQSQKWFLAELKCDDSLKLILIPPCQLSLISGYGLSIGTRLGQLSLLNQRLTEEPLIDMLPAYYKHFLRKIN